MPETEEDARSEESVVVTFEVNPLVADLFDEVPDVWPEGADQGEDPPLSMADVAEMLLKNWVKRNADL